MNPLPRTVSVRFALSMAAPDGEIPETDGAGFAKTVKEVPFERPPPDGTVGFFTLMEFVPTAVRSAAGMVPLICVAFINDVVRSDPFHWIVDPATKPLP